MDPITAAIIAGIAAGAASGATDVVTKHALTEGYNALKQRLKTKFGDKSEVALAVDAVEAKPDSAGRRETLKEEITASHADGDAELLLAAQALLAKIDAMPGGRQILQTVTGDSNIAIVGSGNTVTVQQAPAGEKKT